MRLKISVEKEGMGGYMPRPSIGKMQSYEVTRTILCPNTASSQP